MRLFAIGDTHLPSTRGKSMDKFGWTDHPLPLQRAWDAQVRAEDVVIVAGDISWATRPAEVGDDLKWLDERPGRKVLLRGNHDFWWGDSATKLRRVLAPYPSLEAFLHNCAVVIGPWVIAGTRLWTADQAPSMAGRISGGEMGDEPPNTAYVERETKRLEISIKDAIAQQLASAATLTRIVAVHFPPLYSNREATPFSHLIESFKPTHCVYGHLHSTGIPAGFVGEHGGVEYHLVSCDAAQFSPVLIDEK